MRLVTSFLLCSVLLCSFSVLASEQAEANPVSAPEQAETTEGVGKSYGDWTEFCDKDVDGAEMCNISQTLTRQGSQHLLLSIRVNFVPGKNKPIVFATLPLGGLLTYSPLLKVGKSEPLKLAYQFCDISGCTAVAVLTDEIVGSLKTETQAVVQYVNIARKAIGIPVSLRGFSKGLKKLSETRPKAK